MKFGIGPDAHVWGKFKRRFWGDYVRQLQSEQKTQMSASSPLCWKTPPLEIRVRNLELCSLRQPFSKRGLRWGAYAGRCSVNPTLSGGTPIFSTQSAHSRRYPTVRRTACPSLSRTPILSIVCAYGTHAHG